LAVALQPLSQASGQYKEACRVGQLQKYATALFGLGIFILAILAIRTSGLLEAAFAPQVESGNVSAVDATWFLTVAESVVSFLFTWAVVFFVRLGESGIAFGRTFFGFKSDNTPAKPNAEIVVDLNKDMRELYAALQTKRNAVVAKADADIQASIQRAVKETKEQILK
jgi:hypothetical protein